MIAVVQRIFSSQSSSLPELSGSTYDVMLLRFHDNTRPEIISREVMRELQSFVELSSACFHDLH